MFDTMVFTKALGALSGALLIFLLGSWVANSIFVPGSRDATPAFILGLEEDATSGGDEAEEAPAELTLAEAFPMADADAGARVWNQCRACHVADEQRNNVGPYLQNVVGRDVAVVDGFRYSGALPEGERWTVETLFEYLEDPRGWAPGTSMAFNGLRDPMDRVNVIAFLIDNSPDYDPATDAPSIEEAAAEEATEEEVAEAPAEEATEEEVAEAPAEEATEEEVAEAPAEEATEEEVAEAPAEEATEEEVAEAPAEEATEEEVAEAPAEEEASEFVQMVANGDVRAGSRVWNQCRACHVADTEQNRVGPHLVGVIGRQSNSIEGFRYSGALPDVVWTKDVLNEYLERPRDFAPGTSMAFNGLRNIEDRANLLAYFESLE